MLVTDKGFNLSALVLSSMSGCKKYKILFDYQAREPDEINLKKGKVGSNKYYL